MTEKEFAELQKRIGSIAATTLKEATKPSKLKNVRKEVEGIKFQSSLEAQAYTILKLWLQAGAISDLRLQPCFTLQNRFKDANGKLVRAITYSADFSFFDGHTRKVRWIDVKGHITELFKRSMKLLKDSHPDVEIELWDAKKIRELSRA